MTTREKILQEALTQFSVRGFDAVSVRDLAYAVGIKESSLYNHFKNKQDIFDSLLETYEERWGSVFQQMRLAGEDGHLAVDKKTANRLKRMTNRQFATLAGIIFNYYMTDDINVKFRRMLSIAHTSSEKAAAMFRRVAFDDSIAFLSQLFEALMEAGLFVRTDPGILALEFFSPFFLIFFKCGSDPESFTPARQLFLRHLEHFTATYGLRP